MEKKMETAIVYWGCIGMVKKKMETMGDYRGYTSLILGLYWN